VGIAAQDTVKTPYHQGDGGSPACKRWKIKVWKEKLQMCTNPVEKNVVNGATPRIPLSY